MTRKRQLLIMGITTALLVGIPNLVTAMVEIPAIFSHVIKNQADKMVLIDQAKNNIYPQRAEDPPYTLAMMEKKITGTRTGLAFDFGNFEGILYYGLINFRDGQYPLPVFYKRPARIERGKAEIEIRKALSGKYDLSSWEKSGKGTLGYRVVDTNGKIIYDGRVAFLDQDKHFLVNVTFLEGPTVHNVTNNSATIAFDTNLPSTAVVQVGNQTITVPKLSQHHEVKCTDLTPDTHYDYTVEVTATSIAKPNLVLANSQSYAFHTAPNPGSRKPFIFAYASDSRNATGGGERDIHGTNAYLMKKLMAVVKSKGAAFLQFTGDMIDGRLNNLSQTRLQYRNWKRSIEPFAHYLPVYATLGNHEGLFHIFDDGSRIGITVDRFPFATESAEAIFAEQFVLPENGPISEDGSAYDPNPQISGDFPTYQENVYYYIYDNVAIVVLNTNYLFSRSFKYWFAKQGKSGSLLAGGGLHGYLMDKQLEWLEEVLDKLETDPNIDFIFTTQHTPLFPNGGHRVDDMWYDGNNLPRPHIAGNSVQRGVIEQRDRYLELLLKHRKVIAVLSGDEHNYARFKLTPTTVIYPPTWDKPKLAITRSLWQINNGAAGAPYYAQEVLPWSNQVEIFSTQNAVVFFHVHGRKLRIEVINPDTLERFE